MDPRFREDDGFEGDGYEGDGYEGDGYEDDGYRMAACMYVDFLIHTISGMLPPTVLTEPT
jgi:hypothetical protein